MHTHAVLCLVATLTVLQKGPPPVPPTVPLQDLAAHTARWLNQEIVVSGDVWFAEGAIVAIPPASEGGEVLGMCVGMASSRMPPEGSLQRQFVRSHLTGIPLRATLRGRFLVPARGTVERSGRCRFRLEVTKVISIKPLVKEERKQPAPRREQNHL